MRVGPAYTFVDHLIQRQFTVPLHVHADVYKHGHNAGVLAQRPVPLGTHARIDQNLGHGIPGRLGLFPLVGFMNRVNEILGVVIGNELQRVRYAFNQVVLADYGRYGGSSDFQEARVYQKIPATRDPINGEGLFADFIGMPPHNRGPPSTNG